MSRSIANDHRATQSRSLSLILPMPRSSHWVVSAPSPWVAVDPVFGAQCVAFYRSVRFTLLALIAFLAGPRSMRAGRTERTTEIGSLTRLPQPHANASASEQSARRAFPRCFSRKPAHNDANEDNCACRRYAETRDAAADGRANPCPSRSTKPNRFVPLLQVPAELKRCPAAWHSSSMRPNAIVFTFFLTYPGPSRRLSARCSSVH